MNNEMNLFNPLDLDLSRSTFHMTPTRSTTCNAGRLIPLFSMGIMPGDSIRMDCETLVKMSTPVYPTMDLLYFDNFFFFVSYDLILGRRYGTPSVNDSNQSWKAIIGSQDNLLNMPVPDGLPEIPHVYADDPAPMTLLDYLGFDSAVSSDMNCFPALAYFAIWNENFRDESLMTPVTWSFNESNELVPYGNVPLYASKMEVLQAARDYGETEPDYDYKYINALADSDDSTDSAVKDGYAWLPFPVCVFHGYFGSALPWPQRNLEGVELPLGDLAPVITGDEHYKLGDEVDPTKSLLASRSSSSAPFVISGQPGNNAYSKYSAASGGFLSSFTSSSAEADGNAWIYSNLWTDLSKATAANVNALRMAIQQQRWYEKLARSGNRYDELKYGLFGVRSMDSGKDRPLYLGGKRIPLKVEMVASTNGGTDSGSSEAAGSLGQLGAFSHTNDNDHYFYHSFDDWGILMCLCTVRCHQSFASGMDAHLKFKTREDFYFPTFAHLGEQLLDSGLISYSPGTPFGYQQAWEEHRQIPDRVSGLLKVPAGQEGSGGLSFMTYADRFENPPTLASFINASRYIKNVDDTLKVTSNASGFQFIVQQTFKITARRPLPTYSIPGLMDHF